MSGIVFLREKGLISQIMRFCLKSPEKAKAASNHLTRRYYYRLGCLLRHHGLLPVYSRVCLYRHDLHPGDNLFCPGVRPTCHVPDVHLDDHHYLQPASAITRNWQVNRQLDFPLGSTLYPVGDADTDVTAEGLRAAGKFDKNYILFLRGTARYLF